MAVSEVTTRRGVFVAFAAAVLALLLVGGPLLAVTGGSAGHDVGGDGVEEVSLQPVAARNAASMQIEAALDGPVFQAREVPVGFVLDRNEVVDGLEGERDKAYLAFIRGADPDAEPDFGVLRVYVIFGSAFDADVWLQAEAGVEAEEGPGARESSKTTVRGHEAILESPLTEQGHTVLRWGERADVQIIVSGTATVSEADLRTVAESLAEVTG